MLFRTAFIFVGSSFFWRFTKGMDVEGERRVVFSWLGIEMYRAGVSRLVYNGVLITGISWEGLSRERCLLYD